MFVVHINYNEVAVMTPAAMIDAACSFVEQCYLMIQMAFHTHDEQVPML